MKTIFKNLKVIELSSVLAGPLCGSFFAELGAQVLKIENKTTGGDVTRQWKLSNESKIASLGSYYAAANFGKTIQFLDLNEVKDKQMLMTEIAKADVLISNYKPSTTKKYQLNYEYIKQHNTSVIYAQLNGFEESNNRGAYDAVLQAEAGFMYMNGVPEMLPVKIPFAVVDVLSNHQMREAILVALLQKTQTGKGAHIKVSMLKSAVSALINQASNFLMNGNIPKRIGSAHPSIAPYGDTFTTSDGAHIVLAVGSQKQFVALCTVLNIQEIIEDTKFITNQNRVNHRAELFDILHKKIKEWDTEKLMQQFIQNEVPAGLIKNMKQVFEHPLAQSMVKEETIENQQTRRVSTIAFEITG